MSRVYRSLALVALCVACLAPAWSLDLDSLSTPSVVTEPNPHRPVNPAPRPNLPITFTSATPHMLFRPGEPIVVTAHVTNPGEAEHATVTLRLGSAFGCMVQMQSIERELPARGESTIPFTLDTTGMLPYGSYRVEAWVQTTRDIGYGATTIAIWPGPSPVSSTSVGISYQGPLNCARTWSDLDLFRDAGVQWLHFPLVGWLPTGDATPREAAEYQAFIPEAMKRGYSLVASFTPKTTVDPSVNTDQADKEYRESLLAAASRFGFAVKYWELRRVKPDPNYPSMKGIGYQQVAAGRAALRAFDKSLTALYAVEPQFKWNVLELFHLGVPAKGDLLGLRYDFIGIPEERRATPCPPLYDLEMIVSEAKSTIKRSPGVWVTEYGFDPAKGERLPQPALQAALLSRTLLLDYASPIERSFWRHNPSSTHDIPFTNADGSVQPTLLALRNTLRQLEGKTSVAPLKTVASVRAYLLIGGKKQSTRATLVVWSEGEPTNVAFKTTTPVVTVTDLWGNSLELRPTSGTAQIPVDEFPRFVDLGGDTEVQLFPPFARFVPARLLLRDGNSPAMQFEIFNDARLFDGAVTLDIHFRRWPVSEGTEIKSQRVTLQPYDRQSMESALSVPLGSTPGQIYEVNVDMMSDARRLGYLTLPVWYQPGAGVAPR